MERHEISHPEPDAGHPLRVTMHTDEEPAIWAKSVVNWSAVWVGLLTAMALNLVLYILGVAVALTAAEVTDNNFVTRTMQTAGIWSALASLIALFIGGYCAGRIGIQSGLRSGAMQGSLVWTLFVIVGLTLSAFGLGGMASGLASVSELRALITNRPDLGTAELTQMVRTAAASLWWVVGGLVLSWLAAAFGGVVGVNAAKPDTIAG